MDIPMEDSAKWWTHPSAPSPEKIQARSRLAIVLFWVFGALQSICAIQAIGMHTARISSNKPEEQGNPQSQNNGQALSCTKFHLRRSYQSTRSNPATPNPIKV
jgi:hypothetical protein